MSSPQKPARKKMGWLDFALGVASRAAGKTWGEMRTEFAAGRTGQESPRTPAIRGAPPPGPPWWEVLGVPRGAKLAEVTAVYRERMRQNHPDKVAHLSVAIRRVAEEETLRLNAAYARAQRALAPKR